MDDERLKSPVLDYQPPAERRKDQHKVAKRIVGTLSSTVFATVAVLCWIDMTPGRDYLAGMIASIAATIFAVLVAFGAIRQRASESNKPGKPGVQSIW